MRYRNTDHYNKYFFVKRDDFLMNSEDFLLKEKVRFGVTNPNITLEDLGFKTITRDDNFFNCVVRK